MSFVTKTLALSAAGLVFSAGAAFAQVGGGDVPTDAKAQGTKENGSSSTGMSKGDAMMKSGGGSMSTGSRGTATGGNAGGAAGRN